MAEKIIVGNPGLNAENVGRHYQLRVDKGQISMWRLGDEPKISEFAIDGASGVVHPQLVIADPTGYPTPGISKNTEFVMPRNAVLEEGLFDVNGKEIPQERWPQWARDAVNTIQNGVVLNITSGPAAEKGAKDSLPTIDATPLRNAFDNILNDAGIVYEENSRQQARMDKVNGQDHSFAGQLDAMHDILAKDRLDANDLRKLQDTMQKLTTQTPPAGNSLIPAIPGLENTPVPGQSNDDRVRLGTNNDPEQFLSKEDFVKTMEAHLQAFGNMLKAPAAELRMAKPLQNGPQGLMIDDKPVGDGEMRLDQQGNLIPPGVPMPPQGPLNRAPEGPMPQPPGNASGIPGLNGSTTMGPGDMRLAPDSPAGPAPIPGLEDPEPAPRALSGGHVIPVPNARTNDDGAKVVDTNALNVAMTRMRAAAGLDGELNSSTLGESTGTEFADTINDMQKLLNDAGGHITAETATKLREKLELLKTPGPEAIDDRIEVRRNGRVELMDRTELIGPQMDTLDKTLSAVEEKLGIKKPQQTTPDPQQQPAPGSPPKSPEEQPKGKEGAAVSDPASKTQSLASLTSQAMAGVPAAMMAALRSSMVSSDHNSIVNNGPAGPSNERGIA